MIEFKDVFIKYSDDFYTLFDINIRLTGNTLLVGSVNDGCYSLMRILAKVDKNYQGEVFIDEKNIKELKDKELNLRYVPHIPYLFSNKTIEFNLAYPLKLRKYKKTDIKTLTNDKINKYFSNFPKKIKKLDNNQKKLIALARAGLSKPKYVLIEDFFSDLDNAYWGLAYKIIDEIKANSTIIACENTDKYFDCFSDFEKIFLDSGSKITN